MTATDLDHAQLLRDLLRGRPLATPTGTPLYAHNHGRTFRYLDLDRFGLDQPFPADVIEVARPISEHLARLALYRRDIPAGLSRWDTSGSFYAPTACAAALLGVLLALDAGDVEPARSVAGFIADAHTSVMAERTRTARRKAAVEAVAQLERVLPAVLAANGVG